MNREIIFDGKTYNCRLHHRAYAQGYVPVGETRLMPYKGRFGVGFTIDTNSEASTRYCNREYWIREEEETHVDSK